MIFNHGSVEDEYSLIVDQLAARQGGHRELAAGDTSNCMEIVGKDSEVVVIIDTAAHPDKIENVVKFLEKLGRLKSRKEKGGKTYIFQEKISGTPVTNLFLDGSIATYTSEKKIELALKIIEEVETLHSAGIMHGDLHPDNIMLDSSGNIKVIDFDLSEETEADGNVQDPKNIPEGDHHDPKWKDGSECSLASDIYSLGHFMKEGIGDFLGMRLHEMDADDDAQRQAIEKFTEVITSCMDETPAKRPKIAELKAAVEALKSSFEPRHSPRASL